MTAHVCLLRGINVGGNNIIPMAALAKTFERMRFSAVKTFIASGNVLFAAPAQDLRKLEQKIERELERDFDYEAKVVVKSRAEMDAIVRGIPWKKPNAAMRYYVIFLRHAVDDKQVLEQLTPAPGVETLDYKPGALYWAAKRDKLAKSKVAKLGNTKLYQDVTIRNLNTTLKLGELIAAVKD